MNKLLVVVVKFWIFEPLGVLKKGKDAFQE